MKMFFIFLLAILTSVLLLSCGSSSTDSGGNDGGDDGGDVGGELPTGALSLLAVYPIHGATDVDTNSRVYAVFSEEIDEDSTFGSFAMFFTGGVHDDWHYFKTDTIEIAPNYFSSEQLLAGTKYTVALDADRIFDIHGNNLAANYLWSFTTTTAGGEPVIEDTTPITVTSVSPTNGSSGVSRTPEITFVFSEPFIDTIFSILTNIDFSGSRYSITTALDTLNFYPIDTLNPNTTYSVTLQTGIEDLWGNNLQSNYVYSFTTGN